MMRKRWLIVVIAVIAGSLVQGGALAQEIPPDPGDERVADPDTERYDWVYPHVNGFARTEYNGLFGFIDWEGEIVSLPKWNYAKQYHFNGLAEVYDGKKWGVLNSQGELMLQCLWDSVEILDSENAIVVERGDYWAVYDTEGVRIFETSEGSIQAISQGSMIILLQNGRFKLANFEAGLKNEDWYYIDSINDGYASVYEKDGIWSWAVLEEDEFEGRVGYLNVHEGGRVAFLIEGEEIAPTFAENIAWFKKNGKYGYVNKQGEIFVEPLYETAEPFIEGIALVSQKDSKAPSGLVYAGIDSSGKVVVKYEGEYVKSSVETGIVWSRLDGSEQNCYTLLNRFTGQPVCEDVWESAEDYSCGWALVGRAGEYWYINKNGENVFNIRWAKSKSFYNGYAFVMNDEGLWGTIDTNGREITSPRFEEIVGFQGGFYSGVHEEAYTMAQCDGEYYYINELGEILGPGRAEEWYTY